MVLFEGVNGAGGDQPMILCIRKALGSETRLIFSNGDFPWQADLYENPKKWTTGRGFSS